MTSVASSQVLRRWRSILVLGVLVGAGVGWVTAPGKGTATFQATSTLLLDPNAGRFNLQQASALAVLGPVPNRVAARTGLAKGLVQSGVTTYIPLQPGELLVTGRSTDGARAVALANLTAQELVVQLGGSNSPLQILEPAVASPDRRAELGRPTSRRSRAAVLGGFGLFLGIVAAFGLERFDNRIASARAAEEVLGAPVIAEVPPLRRSDRGRLIPAGRASPIIEAYRGLRAMVERSAEISGGGSKCIVVAAATGGAGTTTVVAQLAAALAEVGHTVVAVSADLRRPRLHLYFDRPREPGLSEVLRGAPDVRRLSALNQTSGLRGIRFVASGAPVRNPGSLIDEFGAHLGEAREMGEFVLIDSPPLLAASEAADLARQADAVLLVVRAGGTSIGAAARASELLERLGVPVLGAVLVGGGAARRRRYRQANRDRGASKPPIWNLGTRSSGDVTPSVYISRPEKKVL